jgi:hypothetical protein
MKSFLQMWNILELAELGTNKPAPLSKITPELAKVAVTQGTADSDPPNQNKDAAPTAKIDDPVAVGSLKPMQKEVIPSKAVAFALGFLRDGKPDLNDMEAIVSSDNYIMDGHHRWAARILIDPSASVKVARVGLPASNLTTALNLWTKSKGRAGNPGKGDIKQFAASVPQVLEQFIQNGTDQWPNLSAEEVVASLTKLGGGNLDNGKQVMIGNAQKLPTDRHPDAPERVDMPVVKNKQEIDDVIKKLMSGEIDWNVPLSNNTLIAAGATNQNVGANVQATPNNSGNAVATPNANQQNVGANMNAPGTGQINVGANLPNQQNKQQTVQKFPQQQPQRQVAHTDYNGPNLNEWAILAGIKK